MPRICHGAVESRHRGQDSDVGFVVQQLHVVEIGIGTKKAVVES